MGSLHLVRVRCHANLHQVRFGEMLRWNVFAVAGRWTVNLGSDGRSETPRLKCLFRPKLHAMCPFDLGYLPSRQHVMMQAGRVQEFLGQEQLYDAKSLPSLQIPIPSHTISPSFVVATCSFSIRHLEPYKCSNNAKTTPRMKSISRRVGKENARATATIGTLPQAATSRLLERFAALECTSGPP